MNDQPQKLNIPELSTHYYKSRNSLLLFSGLLLAWEFMDIKVGEVVEIVAIGTKVEIGNIKALPIVFLILIGYFAFRLVIEWKQSDTLRRVLAQSRVDFYVSLVIPILAIIIYTIQAILDISIYSDYKLYFYTGLALYLIYYEYLYPQYI